MVREGGLQQLIDDDGIRGVTSNPTIFEKAIGGGEGYDDQLRELHEQGGGAEDAFWDLAVDDIGRGADLLRPIHDRLDRGDGFISIEVSPLLAHDTEATIAQAAALFARLARPNVLIKIPATLEGIPAIEETIAAGHQRERHADLQPRASRRGHRGVPQGSRAARRRRRRPRRRAARSRRSS